MGDHVEITWYRDGFIVGSGAFRPLANPLNKKFVDELTLGRCPEELSVCDAPVHVAVIDRRTEDYNSKEPEVPLPPAPVAFSGEGNTLGGSSSSSRPVAPVQL